MATASAAAEAAVKKLARLPSNAVCPNCGTQKNFGFSTVCIKYLTFVCNNCKASHQAVSHRCKSLTMSAWTDGEVLALKKAGNDHARATWLAKAPPCGQGGRPKEGDHIDVFKAFIVDVYERKRYYEEGGEISPDPAAPPKPFATVKAVAGARQRVPPPTPHNTLSAPAGPPPAAPVLADLLDFGAFDSATPFAAPPPPSQPPAQALFSFAPASAPPTTWQQTQPTSFDAFGGFSSQPLAAIPPSASAPSPFLSPPPAAAVPSDPFGLQPKVQAPSFDPFGTGNNINSKSSSMPATEQPPAMKNVTGLANGPTPPVMAMNSPFGNPGMMMQQQPMGNGMMGNNNGRMAMGGPMGGPMMGGPTIGGPTMGGPIMGGNFPMMMGHNNPHVMTMMNAQQQLMMNQMGQKPGNGMMTTPGVPFAGTFAMGNATGGGLTMINSVGPMGGGTTMATSSSRHPSFASQPQQPKKHDPFAGIGL